MDEEHDMNTRTVRAFVATLNDRDRKKFLASYGGGDDPFSHVLDSFDDPRKERSARDKIEQLFGLKLLTTAECQEAQARHEVERQRALSERSAEATARQAEAAEEANRIAHQANETARHSLRVSWWNTTGTVAAAIAAIVALIVSLWK